MNLPINDRPLGVTTLDPRVANIWQSGEVSVGAELLYLRAAVHSARHGGFIALNLFADLARGIPKPKEKLAELLEVGLWWEVEWGWRMELYGTRHRSTTHDRHLLNDALRTAVLKRDGYECQACGTTERLVIDHIVPIVKGGRTVLANLQALCAPCNGSKGTLDWEEWLARR